MNKVSITPEHCDHCNADLKYEKDGRVYTRLISIEYGYGSPERYDGISELKCPDCGTRIGRWTGNVLRDGELEPRFGGRR